MIRYGSQGSAVYTWQYFLANVQGYDITVDGIFGQGTHNATVHFQQACGLSADGVVGPNTINTAYQYGYTEGETAAPVSNNSIAYGSRGDAVYAWQNFLANVQGYNIAVDGIFGQGTYEATVHFQQVVGLTADGVVGTNTINTAYHYGYVD